MGKTIRNLLLTGVGLAGVTAILVSFKVAQFNREFDNTPITQPFDVDRYLGKWYEIARYNHKFQREMTGCTAVYTLKSKGKILVTNQGYRKGKFHESIGHAKITDENGLLRVSFFRPFYSDYRVLMLASDYSYALVGSNRQKYLWILSRTPILPSDVLNTILKEARGRGYDTQKLMWVQNQNVKQLIPDTN